MKLHHRFPAPGTDPIIYIGHRQFTDQHGKMKVCKIRFGKESEQGHTWVDQLLGHLLEGRFENGWEALTQSRSRLRSKTKRKAMDDLMRYLLERREKVAYANFRSAGLDIGSGPTESMCKCLSRRMKGIGMR